MFDAKSNTTGDALGSPSSLAALHLMLLLARSVLGFIDSHQLGMRGRSMVVYVYIHRRAASDVLNLLIYA